MRLYSRQNNILPAAATTHTLSNHASFYASLSVNERFERLGSGQEFDLLGTSVARSSFKSQMNFARKVFLICLIQSLVITATMTVFIRFLSQWQEESKYLWWVILFPAIVFSVITLWQLYTQYYQLSMISRVALLVIYSLLMAFILADLVSALFHEYGLIVATMSSCSLLSVVLYTFQSKFRFQGTKPIFCCIATICISSIGLRELYQLNPVQILGPMAVSSLICAYFILDLYYMMDIMTVEDYILAYVSFHIDLAYPINCIHHVCEISDEVDDFPEYFNPNPSHG